MILIQSSQVSAHVSTTERPCEMQIVTGQYRSFIRTPTPRFLLWAPKRYVKLVPGAQRRNYSVHLYMSQWHVRVTVHVCIARTEGRMFSHKNSKSKLSISLHPPPTSLRSRVYIDSSCISWRHLASRGPCQNYSHMWKQFGYHKTGWQVGLLSESNRG